ncbi:MAG: EamA/RhaT family transporter [Thermotogae bacterium]|nr:MAG: EamA/RhaT family transporter [Thermotogota bacterium]
MKSLQKSVLALLVAATIQGSTFPLQKLVLPGVSPFVFNALRFGFAAAVSFFVFGRGDILRGAILGAVLSVGYVTQTWGLTLTSASKSGFIVSLYTVLIPIFSYIVEREKITRIQGIAFALSVLGSYLLSGGVRGFNLGDLLMLICAASFALHIVLITRFSRQVAEGQLLFPQFLTVALINAMAGVTKNWGLSIPIYFVAIYSALLATVLGIYLQLRFQKEVGSNRTGLIFVMLPVSSTIFSYLILGERLSPLQITGALIMVIAIVVSSLGNGLTVREEDKA